MDLNPEIFGHGQGAADAKCFNHQPEWQLVETSTISVLKSAYVTGNTQPNLTGTLTGLQLQLELLGADLTNQLRKKHWKELQKKSKKVKTVKF
jgi:hypothetical protein